MCIDVKKFRARGRKHVEKWRINGERSCPTWTSWPWPYLNAPATPIDVTSTEIMVSKQCCSRQKPFETCFAAVAQLYISRHPPSRDAKKNSCPRGEYEAGASWCKYSRGIYYRMSLRMSNRSRYSNLLDSCEYLAYIRRLSVVRTKRNNVIPSNMDYSSTCYTLFKIYSYSVSSSTRFQFVEERGEKADTSEDSR